MFRQIVRTENIKLKRSFLLYLHLFVLVAFPLLFGFYYGSRKNAVNASGMVTTFYELLAIASPIVISIVICQVFDREEKAGNFKNWLTEPTSKAKMIQGQLVYYWLWYAVEILGTSLLFYCVLTLVFQVKGIPLGSFLLTSICFAILGFFQYELAQLLVLKANIAGALILGFLGTVLACLAVTSLLDFIWPIIPWAWPVRLITFWLDGISQGLRQLAALEYLVSLVIMVFGSLAIGCYFNHWQGKKE